MPFAVFNRSSRHANPEQDLDSDASSDNGTIVKLYDEALPDYFAGNGHLWDKDIGKQQGPGMQNPSSDVHLPSGTALQLANALGPDNIPQTTEIDTVPCAGVRIPQGPLSGLLAWRLVVSVQKRKGNWWEDEETTRSLRRRRGQSIRTLPPAPNERFSECVYSAESFATRSHPHLESLIPLQESLVANFILDTGLPLSLISRDTLLALGYPSSQFTKGSAGDARTVTLSVQGVSTRFFIANDGEANRLGVQFLHDAGVSVFFPRNGVGVGPVLYLESARILDDIPTTLPATQERKLTLQQRVRALFGLAQ